MIMLLKCALIIIKASQVALVAKDLPVNAGDVRDARWIPGLGRSPAGGHGNPRENPSIPPWRISMDRGAGQAWGRKESDTTEVTEQNTKYFTVFH